MLQALRSNLRRTIITTLVFGALTVIGLAAFPFQSAHAAVSDEASASVVQEKGKPTKTIVHCSRSAAGTLHGCDRQPEVGDVIEVTIAGGECVYGFKAEEVTAEKLRGTIKAVNPKDGCKGFGIERRDWANIEYVVDAQKSLPDPYKTPKR